MNRLYLGDCTSVLPSLPDRSIDMVLCDLPYGVTRNKWDSVIPLDWLWGQYRRLVKPNAAVVLFGQDKFSARLMLSNEKWHRYNLVWEKDRVSGFLNAKRMPLRSHEDILVFYEELPIYHPQMTEGKPSHAMGTKFLAGRTNNNYGDFRPQAVDSKTNQKFPRSVLRFPRPHPPIHPTQKPVELLSWLIRTYTNPGQVVLDNTMGVGSTCLASHQEGRGFVGIELDPGYFGKAVERLNQAGASFEAHGSDGSFRA
jgi:site-specific DNA-methyltransferase (adenine-specific)